MLLRLLVASLVVPVSLSAAPQLPEPQYRVAWPLDPVPGVRFGRAEVGRFTPYNGRSVAVQWGGRVLLACSPVNHSFCADVYGSGVSSFVTWPGGVDSDRDSLLVSHTGGLTRVTLDASGLLAYEDLTTLGANALDLECAELTGDGQMDVALVDAATPEPGQVATIRIFASSGSALVEAFHFGVPEVPTDIELIQWDLESGYELALQRKFGTDASGNPLNGTEVYELTGQLLWSRGCAKTGPVFMAVLPPEPTIPMSFMESLATITPGAVNRLLTVFCWSGNAAAISLGPNPIVDMDAGDRNGDNYADLAVTYAAGDKVRIYKNEGGFTSGNWLDLPIGSGGLSDNAAEVCLADLNDDRMAEVFSAAQSNNWLTVIPGASFALPIQYPTDSVPPFMSYHLWTPSSLRSADYCSPACAFWPSDRAGVELEISNVWQAQMTSQQTHLEVTLWGVEKGQTGEGSVGVFRVAIRHALYGIPVGAAGTDFRNGDGRLRVGFYLDKDPSDPEGDPLTAFLDLEGDDLEYFPQGERYYLEIRPVCYMGSNITQPLTAHCGGFTYVDASREWAITNLVVNNPGSTEILLPMFEHNTPAVDPAPWNNDGVGGFIKVPRIPPKLRPHVLPFVPPITSDVITWALPGS